MSPQPPSYPLLPVPVAPTTGSTSHVVEGLEMLNPPMLPQLDYPAPTLTPVAS